MLYRNATENEKDYVLKYLLKRYARMWSVCTYTGSCLLFVFGYFFIIFVCSMHPDSIPYLLIAPFGIYFMILAKKIDKKRELFKNEDFVIQEVKIIQNKGIPHFCQKVIVKQKNDMTEKLIVLSGDFRGCDEGYLVLPISENSGDKKPVVVPIKY